MWSLRTRPPPLVGAHVAYSFYVNANKYWIKTPPAAIGACEPSPLPPIKRCTPTHLLRTACTAEAYRRAVDVSPRDYRAWYGLGQTYELVNMPYYALYYFRRRVLEFTGCINSGGLVAWGCGRAPLGSARTRFCFKGTSAPLCVRGVAWRGVLLLRRVCAGLAAP